MRSPRWVKARTRMKLRDVDISVCTTNYNCAHALTLHLESVFRGLKGLDFEYIVVDNMSRDRSWEILADWRTANPNFQLLSKRCTMGEGRQVAFLRSTGRLILVLDTDVVYDPLLRQFVDRCLASNFPFAIQALFCGVFPRGLWNRVGGRRSLNTNEDVDMWIRLWRIGMIKWYSVPMGTNLKEPNASGSYDYLSGRYTHSERTLRLLRREWDLFKTRSLQKVDLKEIIHANAVDLDLGREIRPWPQNRSRQTAAEHVIEFVRQAKQAIRTP
jgi:glycosyltransferase involved in cell wall biosynthesis